MPTYIEKSGDLVGTNKQTRKNRATQPLDHGRLRWAIFHPVWKRDLSLSKLLALRRNPNNRSRCHQVTIHRSEFSTSLLFHPLLTSHTGNYTCQVVMVMRLIVVMMMVVMVVIMMLVAMMVVMMMVVMVVQLNYMKKMSWFVKSACKYLNCIGAPLKHQALCPGVPNRRGARFAGAQIAAPSRARGPICHGTKKCGAQICLEPFRLLAHSLTSYRLETDSGWRKWLLKASLCFKRAILASLNISWFICPISSGDGTMSIIHHCTCPNKPKSPSLASFSSFYKYKTCEVHRKLGTPLLGITFRKKQKWSSLTLHISGRPLLSSYPRTENGTSWHYRII